MAKTAQGKKVATKAPAKNAQSTAKSKKPAAPKKDEPELTDDMIEEIGETVDNLKEELSKCQKNAAAAKRARKATTTLEKQFKQFRKASNEYHRKSED